MRKALLLLSCVNVVLLGVDELLYGLLDLMKQPQLSQVDQIVKAFALASLLVSLILLGIYVIRQIIVRDRQLKKRGRRKVFSGNILHTTSPEIKPYRREAWLQWALFFCFNIVGFLRAVANVMYPYATRTSKLETLLDWAVIFGLYLCVLVYAALSRDLTKVNKV